MNERQATRASIMALKDQLSVYRVLFGCLTFLILPLMVAMAVSGELVVMIYLVSLGLLGVLCEINHLVASKLRSKAEQLKLLRDYLSALLKLCRELLVCNIFINPRPEISFFDRLSSLLGLTERPLLNAPLAFRS